MHGHRVSNKYTREEFEGESSLPGDDRYMLIYIWRGELKQEEYVGRQGREDVLSSHSLVGEKAESRERVGVQSAETSCL